MQKNYSVYRRIYPALRSINPSNSMLARLAEGFFGRTQRNKSIQQRQKSAPPDWRMHRKKHTDAPGDATFRMPRRQKSEGH